MENFNRIKNLGYHAKKNLYVEFFKHYTGYATNGELTGYDDPETEKIDKVIEYRLGPVWSNMREELINDVEEMLDDYYPIDDDSPESRMEQLNVAWPKIERWLKYSNYDPDIRYESKMKNTDKVTLTFGQLKKLIKEAK